MDIPLPSRHLVLFALVWLPAACKTRSEPAGTVVLADGATLHPGPIRHETLTPDQMRRIAVLQKTFGDVDPTPLEEWVDDFKRDRNPDREIAIYEAMAQAYTGYCTRHSVTPEARMEVYKLVLVRSRAPDDEVRRTVPLKVLNREQAEEVLRGYPAPPQPIEIGR
jgi:hypothetical protein